jgi:hypothetical protein
MKLELKNECITNSFPQTNILEESQHENWKSSQAFQATSPIDQPQMLVVQ